VTGETPESVRAFLNQRASAIANYVESVADLREWTSQAEVAANPSAGCALELALLDLLGRRANVPIEILLGIEPLAESPQATAVYGDSSWPAFLMQFMAFGRNELNDSKLKLSGQACRDFQRSCLLAPRGRLRLDANNLWADSAQALAHLATLASRAWAVEEPLRVRDFEGMEKISCETGLTIILDESLLTKEDLAALPLNGTFAANIRVSKLGGLVRSFEVLQAALANGLKIVVGAQVGETSILARAGLALASAAGSCMVGYEGGYGLHLLTRDVCASSLTFGRRGEFDTVALSRLASPGLGLEVTLL
jgi:L-alanine-DL-glutamate epimerase-like enolase superfamily enzyme